MEALVAASWLPDAASAKKIVAIASSKPLDQWSQNAAKTAADRLAGAVEKEALDHPELQAPAYLSAEAKKQFIAGQKVYFREGHCATCHQANGKGLDPAFPSLEKSPWVSGAPDRLIRPRNQRQEVRWPGSHDSLWRDGERRGNGGRSHLCAQQFWE
ncbi:MAG: hypothetical protein EBR81_10825 [Proteobacteria bacterium]|nr:hypothetical protein [Pseudomonadota bacterium]